ncbi:MAG: hypothetical protein JXN59_06970 [Anaerolineae bacterium]|nr:hypothetical protein [Anaerolineae bacterium]
MTQAQSSISLLQIGGLMAGLLILSLILIGVALVMTRRGKPADSKRKPEARKSSPARRASQPAPDRSRPAAARRPAPSNPPAVASTTRITETPPAPASAAPPGTAEVLRVYRDQHDDSLIMEVDGTRYRTLGDIKQAGLDKPFLATLRELARIAKETGDQVTRTSPGATQPPDVTQPPAAHLPSMEELTGGAPGISDDRPIGTFFGNMRRMIPGTPAEVSLDQPVGFADQVEAILQLKLLSSAEYRDRDLHVRSTPGGGVEIEVDSKVYEAVGDIEDEGVRAFVQSAIQDWERQQG